MNENYLISIVGFQDIDGEHIKTEFTTTGSYSIKGNDKFIKYRNYTDTALSDSAMATLCVRDDSVVMLENEGLAAPNLILVKGRRNICQYNTGDTSLRLGVATNKFSNTLGIGGGSLELEYSLDVNCGISSTNKLSINVKKIGKGNSGSVKTTTKPQ